MSKILIIGRENAIRSQMMEGFLKKSLGNRAHVYSCGVEPTGVDPQAIRAMAEDHIVIAGQTSDSLEDFKEYQFDHILTFDEELAEMSKKLFQHTPVHTVHLSLIEGFGGNERQEAIRQLRDRLRADSSRIIAELN